MTAFRHDVRKDQELPKKTFLQKAREICDKKNAVLILDDVRAGFRLNRSGSWFDYGVKPDLTAFSKAIGTGISGEINFKSIKILRDSCGKPFFDFSKEIKKLLNDLGIRQSHVSLSDESEYAIAFVILEK